MSTTTASARTPLPLRPVDSEVLRRVAGARSIPCGYELGEMEGDAEKVRARAGQCDLCASLLESADSGSIEPSQAPITLGALRGAGADQERAVERDREHGIGDDLATSEAHLANIRTLIARLGGDTKPYAGDDDWRYLDLRKLYAREFVAHTLSARVANAMEEMTLNGLEVPSADQMVAVGFDAVLDPYLEKLGEIVEAAEALREVADLNNDSVRWPFERNELIERAKGCGQCLREAFGDLPADQLEALVAAVAPAEAFLASLRDEVTG